MHSALLLDDVLRQILEFCPPGCLSACARSCKAFRDPALDSLWSALPSLVPLLNLVPGLVCVDKIYGVSIEGPLDLNVFYSYACRVKHITQRHDTRVHPTLLSLLSQPGTPILNRLTTTRLSSTDLDCMPAELSLTPSLRQLDLDFGFKKKILTDDRNDYIEKLLCVATNIERVRLRGSACPHFNASISQMSSLCSLTLRTGTFLTIDTLISISAFPRLSELEIDAGHLDVDGLTEAWSLPADVGRFQSLQKLHVSAQAPLLELLLRTVQPGSLRALRIEATTSSVCWSSIFGLIRLNAEQTLTDITIEQHLEDLDLDTIPATSTGTNTPSSLQHTRPRTEITFDIIRLLAPLHHLRHLIIDMTHIPNLSNPDIETLATWWPDLVHLDLGSLHSSDCTPLALSPRATLPCLRAFASSTPRLRTLILPVNLEAQVPLPFPFTSSSNLSRGTFSSATPPSDPAALACYLHGLFPGLVEVEGTDGQESAWGEVQSLLRDPQD
ncbi:hypothetical protein C8R43DRAFT_92516 [Mycena crocata]|nr:hypothetical protein C8R43DRAFT_92516 [Mycena crocata]